MTDRCRLLGLEPDGRLAIDLDGRRTIVALYGIAVPQPPTPLYHEILTERINWASLDLHCTALLTGAPPRVRLSYLAARDKSGDIWLDVAELLVEEGAVRVSDESFRERAEWLQLEAAARADRQGIWA